MAKIPILMSLKSAYTLDSMVCLLAGSLLSFLAAHKTVVLLTNDGILDLVKY